MQVYVLLCSLAVVAEVVPAQAVHLVGPGALPTIAAALGIMAPGDIIHVLPGYYPTVPVTQACTIRGLVPGSVHIQLSSGPFFNGSVIFAPPGQAVHLAGLDFDTSNTFEALRIVGGRVTLDECVVHSSFGKALVITDADVHLQRCTVSSSMLYGIYVAMQATNSRVTAINSSFSGSGAATGPILGASPGIDMTGTMLQASSCTIRAGTSPQFGTPALNASGGDVWLADCTVIGNLSCPIVATSVLADRCVLLPALPACATPPSGGLLGVTSALPLQNGAPFTLAYQTVANGFVAVFASQQLATVILPGLLTQPQWLGGGVINLGVVLADAAGQATPSWNIPAASALVDQPLWFQGLTGFAFPLQPSPVAGGLIR